MTTTTKQCELINALAKKNGFESGDAAALRFGITRKGGGKPDIRFDVTSASASLLIDALKEGLHPTTKDEALAIVTGREELGDHLISDVLSLAFGDRYRGNVYRDELRGVTEGASPRVTHTVDLKWIPKEAVHTHGLATVLESLGLELVDPRESAVAKIRDLMATHGLTAADLA